MPPSDTWQSEARDERGRWTTGGSSAIGVLRQGVDAALSGLPMRMRDGLDILVSRFGRNFRHDIGVSLSAGEADVPGILADSLNQLALHEKGGIAGARPETIAALRSIAAGLLAGGASQSAAAARLHDMLAQPGSAQELVETIRAVEQIKAANISELARVLHNEAGSPRDRSIMEAVGHTVLNRMRRNETALVMDVSKAYSFGQNPAGAEAWALATKLINGELPDVTSGATHFYQPIEMVHPAPVTQDARGRLLTDKPPPGYEYVPEVAVKDISHNDVPAFSVRPTWADGMSQVPVRGIPDKLAKFFVAPGSGHVR